MADLQRQGLIRHVGLSNVTAHQVVEGRGICDIACVQNLYNLAHRSDAALCDCSRMMASHMFPISQLAGWRCFNPRRCLT